jgi:predicted nucleotidyltransferase component of viral defense system
MSIINKNLWQEILKEGERLGIPMTKKRGVIREFLQTQILYHLYNFKESRYLVFTGGTALRFLYNSQRLSEDLDFDLLKKISVEGILKKIVKKQVNNETKLVDFKINKKDEGMTAYFKYKTILFDLEISKIPEEKLVIKFDFSYPEDKIDPIKKVFSKFGYLQNVLTYNQSALLSFKTRALFTRKMERGRDLYDIAKLLSFNIKPNYKVRFLKDKNVKNFDDYRILLSNWYKNNKKLLPRLKKQVLPFLVKEEEITFLDLIFKS